MPKISIIVPIYKTPEKFLRECLESLVNQTLHDIEIILVDDGSPDNCGEICEEYAAMDSRIMVVHQRNQGVSIARNHGMKLAQGDWITFVDADDWIELEMCQKVWVKATSLDTDILAWGCFINFKSREFENPFFDEDLVIFEGDGRDKFQLQIISPGIYGEFKPKRISIAVVWCKLYKKSFLLSSGAEFLSKLINGQDQIFNLYASELAEKIIYCNELLYHYRNYNLSAVHRYAPGRALLVETILNECRKFIMNYEKNELFNMAYRLKVINFIPILLQNYFFHKMNKKSFFTKSSELKKFLSSEPYYSALHQIDKTVLSKKAKVIVLFSRWKFAFGLWVLLKVKQLFGFARNESKW